MDARSRAVRFFPIEWILARLERAAAWVVVRVSEKVEGIRMSELPPEAQSSR